MLQVQRCSEYYCHLILLMVKLNSVLVQISIQPILFQVPLSLLRCASTESHSWMRRQGGIASTAVEKNEELGVQEWSADAGEIEHGYDNDGHRQIQH